MKKLLQDPLGPVVNLSAELKEDAGKDGGENRSFLRGSVASERDHLEGGHFSGSMLNIWKVTILADC